MNTATFQAFQAHANGSPFEVCGLILDGPERYFPCRNIAEAADEFRIDPLDWLAAEEQGEILAVCHSHPGSTCKPSGADIKGCESVGIPYMILGADGLWRLDPLAYRSTLVGRPYRWGWADCWTLIRDFHGADMRDMARDEDDAARLYREHYRSFGWHMVPLDELRHSDAVFMGDDHAGVYVGEGKVLHHRRGRLSRVEHLHPSMVTLVLRRTHG